MIGLIERFCRKAYKGLSLFAMLLFLPSAIVILTVMSILAVVEFILLDVVWILLDFIDSKYFEKTHWSLASTISWLMW
jgi:hypothetical protein